LTPKDLRVIVRLWVPVAQSQIPEDCAFYMAEPVPGRQFEVICCFISTLRMD